MLGELYGGLDVHKRLTPATILDARGQEVHHARLSFAAVAWVDHLDPFPAPKRGCPQILERPASCLRCGAFCRHQSDLGSTLQFLSDFGCELEAR